MIDYQAQIDQSVGALFENISRRLSAEDMVRIERAYLLAADAHSEQRRKSGEPYIIHPLAVAEVVAEMGLDIDAILGGNAQKLLGI